MAMYRNVLLVAPDAALADVEAEARGLGDALRPVALRNGVTVRDVTDRIASRSWDVIWFACHGSASGIELTDGPLDTATLVPLVRASGAKLIVLNTCASDMIGIYLWAQTGAAVICTITDVPDKAAYVTGRLLADALGRGMEIDEAFNRSRPGDMAQSTRYRLWIGQVGEQTADTDALRAATVQAMAVVVQPLAQSVEQARAAVEALHSELQEVRGMVQVQQHRSRRQRLLWLAGVALIFTPFLVADTLYAQQILLPWWVGLPVAIILLVVGLWMSGIGNGTLRG